MKYIYILLTTLILSACATGNYQQFSRGVGYQSENAGDNLYKVTYTGSRGTQIKKTNDFALLRCAELTMEKGFDFFVITEAKNNKTELENTQASLIDILPTRMSGNAPVATRGDMSAPPPKSVLTIMLYKNKPDGISYEARRIGKAIKEEYQISEKET